MMRFLSLFLIFLFSFKLYSEQTDHLYEDYKNLMQKISLSAEEKTHFKELGFGEKILNLDLSKENYSKHLKELSKDLNEIPKEPPYKFFSSLVDEAVREKESLEIKAKEEFALKQMEKFQNLDPKKHKYFLYERDLLKLQEAFLKQFLYENANIGDRILSVEKIALSLLILDRTSSNKKVFYKNNTKHKHLLPSNVKKLPSDFNLTYEPMKNTMLDLGESKTPVILLLDLFFRSKNHNNILSSFLGLKIYDHFLQKQFPGLAYKESAYSKEFLDLTDRLLYKNEPGVLARWFKSVYNKMEFDSKRDFNQNRFKTLFNYMIQTKTYAVKPSDTKVILQDDSYFKKVKGHMPLKDHILDAYKKHNKSAYYRLKFKHGDNTYKAKRQRKLRVRSFKDLFKFKSKGRR